MEYACNRSPYTAFFIKFSALIYNTLLKFDLIISYNVARNSAIKVLTGCLTIAINKLNAYHLNISYTVPYSVLQWFNDLFNHHCGYFAMHIHNEKKANINYLSN